MYVMYRKWWIDCGWRVVKSKWAEIAAACRHAAALTNLGYLLYSVKKDYDEAERLYRLAVETSPNDPAALNNLGLLLATARRDFAGAEAMYERALKADPRCAWLRVECCVLRYQLGVVEFGRFRTDVGAC